MRRFLADICLIFLIVTLLNYDFQQPPDIPKQIDTFEEEIARKQMVKAKSGIVYLQEIEENKAASSARNASEWIVGFSETGASIVSAIFSGLFE